MTVDDFLLFLNDASFDSLIHGHVTRASRDYVVPVLYMHQYPYVNGVNSTNQGYRLRYAL